jgi:hypothetical protein
LNYYIVVILANDNKDGNIILKIAEKSYCSILCRGAGGTATADVFSIDPNTLKNSYLLSSNIPLDPTEGPWYTIGQNGKSEWTDLFALPGLGAPTLLLAITIPYSNPYYLPAIVNRGKVSVAFSLDTLTNYLEDIEVDKTTRVYVIDKKGYLVAVRGGLPYKTMDVAGSKVAVKQLASEYDDYIIRESVKVITDEHSLLFNISAYDEDSFMDSTGEGRIVTVSPIRDIYGIDWLVVIVLSRKTERRNANIASIASAIISAAAILTSVIISFVLGLIVTRPLKKLSTEMKNIANMEFHQENAMHKRFSLREFHQVCYSHFNCCSH